MTDRADTGTGRTAPELATIEALVAAGVDIEGVTASTPPRGHHPLVRAIEVVTGLFGAGAALLLVAATCVVSQMIFVRAVLGWSTIWQTDFVIYSATASIFLGAAYVLSQRGHVGVDVVVSMLHGRRRRIVERAAMALGFLFCAAMTYASWHFFHEAWANGWRTETVWAIPLWIPTLPLPLGFALLCLQYVAEFIKHREAAQ